jgi:hypothetical protein
VSAVLAQVWNGDGKMWIGWRAGQEKSISESAGKRSARGMAAHRREGT